jgi:hypothetical protein
MQQPDLDIPLKIGTRGSELALWQAHHVRDELRRHWGDALAIELVLISTEGDRIQDRPLNQIGGKGLFVNAIEEQLVSGAVDLAVHSMKDLPGRLAAGLAVVCTPPREDPRDALVLAPGCASGWPRREQARPRAWAVAGRAAPGHAARHDQPATHGAGPPAEPGPRRPLAAGQRADAAAQARGRRVRRDPAGGGRAVAARAGGGDRRASRPGELLPRGLSGDPRARVPRDGRARAGPGRAARRRGRGRDGRGGARVPFPPRRRLPGADGLQRDAARRVACICAA